VTQSSKPRLAIIGCGAVVEQYHIPALRRLGWKPVLLVDPDVEGIRWRFRDLKESAVEREAVGHYDSFDAAIVAVPSRLHAPICTDLLRAGKHVLVEKPMATTAADARAMVDAADSGAGRLSVVHWRRYRHLSIWTKALMQSGSLGTIESFDFREGAVFNWPATTNSFWRKETAGGGVLADQGAHALDLLLWWLGDFTSLTYVDDSQAGVEADCRLELTMKSGAKGVVELSRTRNLRNSAIIRGSNGWVEIPLWITGDVHASPNVLVFRHGSLDPSGFPPQVIHSLFEAMFVDWLDAMRKGRAACVSGAEAIRYVELIESAYRTRSLWSFPWVTASAASPQHLRRFAGRKVLVTGATGFIGGRLVERLHLDEGAEVAAMVNSFSHAARLARFALEMPKATLTDADAIDRAVAGCKIVFHLAYDGLSPQSNITGAHNLLEACHRHAVERLVYVSSMAVYEPLPSVPLDVTEEFQLPPTRWVYADTKRAIEKAVLDFGRNKGLPVTILQPTIVYGPFGGAFTMVTAERMSRGTLVLPDDGDGCCNAVYVDDLVDAMLLAAYREEALGQRFLISAAEPVTWKEYYSAHERALGVNGLKLMPKDEIARRNRSLLTNLKMLLVRPKRTILKYPALHRSLIKLYGFLPEPITQPVLRLYLYEKAGLGREEFLPTEEEIRRYETRGRVRIDKAEALLGYKPRFSFADGMDLTGQYLQWAFTDAESFEQQGVSKN
jgi:predicted dehydrogenase/nucleoside-diphosphate-sugar epimerase